MMAAPRIQTKTGWRNLTIPAATIKSRRGQTRAQIARQENWSHHGDGQNDKQGNEKQGKGESICPPESSCGRRRATRSTWQMRPQPPRFPRATGADSRRCRITRQKNSGRYAHRLAESSELIRRRPCRQRSQSGSPYRRTSERLASDPATAVHRCVGGMRGTRRGR